MSFLKGLIPLFLTFGLASTSSTELMTFYSTNTY